MSNRVYDVLKWVSVIVVPALVLLINTLGQIWGWKHTAEISATVSAIGVFIGAIIQIASNKYLKNNNTENKED